MQVDLTKPPPDKTPLGHNHPFLLAYMGWLRSGPRLVGRIGSGVRVSASLKIITSEFCATAVEKGVTTSGSFVRGGRFDLLPLCSNV